MKKSILMLLSAFGLNAGMAQSTTSTTTNSDSVKPPLSVSTKFQNDYPNTNATWVMDGDNYAAEYKNMNTNLGTRIIYDMNGNRVSTHNEMGAGKYPVVIGDYYTTNYPKEIYTVWSSDDESGNTTYYSKGKENTIWFDKDGKYMSTIPVSNSKETKTVK